MRGHREEVRAHASHDKATRATTSRAREQHITLLFVEAGGFTTGADKARALLDRVKADVAALDGRTPTRRACASATRPTSPSPSRSSTRSRPICRSRRCRRRSLVIGGHRRLLPLVARDRRCSSRRCCWPRSTRSRSRRCRRSASPSSTRTRRSSARSSSATGSTSASCCSRATARSAGAGRRVEDALAVGVWGARLGTLAAALAAGVVVRVARAHRVPRVPAVRVHRRASA